jgi:uncharacterized protein (TIGR02145 family)
MTGLSPNNQYYARAYATNSTSTSYGASIPFSYYKFRTICSLNWVTENLNRTWYNNGDPIQLITDPTQWATTTSGAYCYVNGSSSNTGAHGLLYNRYALEDPRGIIPRGYRIIDYYDVKGCFTILTGEGGAVKKTGTTYWLSPNTGATDISGFSALGSGYRNSNGTYAAFQQEARFWTSQQGVVPPFNANNRFSLYYNNTTIAFAGDTDYRLGYPVRIIKI